MHKYTKDNMILIERKYALNQLRETAKLIVEKRLLGLTVRTKNSIKVSYPGDVLDVDFFQVGFNAQEDFTSKNDTYQVFFDHSTQNYFSSLYMTLKVQEYIYDKSTDRVYELCTVKAWTEEGCYHDCEPPLETDVPFEKISELHELAMYGYYSTRKKPLNRFVLTTNYGQGREKVEMVLKRSLNDLANEFNLVLSKDIELIINELKRFIYRKNNCNYYNYSIFLLTQGTQKFRCNITFKSLPINSKGIIAMDLVGAEIDEIPIIGLSSESIYSSLDLESQFKKLLLKNIKNIK